MDEILNINSAEDIPPEWDQLALEYFQTREFLIHCEKNNPCSQSYYVLKREGVLVAGAVVYTLAPDLFTYLKIKSPVKMRICGIPCSVSASGLLGRCAMELLPVIFEQEKGLKLFLNLEHRPQSGQATGHTLPTIVVPTPFKAVAEYEGAMRYEYRRRYRKSRTLFRNVKTVVTGCEAFGEAEYRLYLNVLNRSRGKLETLSCKFFAELPPVFRLTRFYGEGKLLGWHITVLYRRTMYFFLGGIEYSLNNEYETYFNILYDIIEKGIEGGAEYVDLGQTAEIPKLRTGGSVVDKYMLAQHSSRVFSRVIKLAGGILEYRYKFPRNRVFKEEADI